MKLDNNKPDTSSEHLIKTLKRNEQDQNDVIGGLKREIEKLKEIIRRQNEKIQELEGEVSFKDQEIRRLYEDRKKDENLLRIEKDKYFNLEIDFKKVTMELEILEK